MDDAWDDWSWKYWHIECVWRSMLPKSIHKVRKLMIWARNDLNMRAISNIIRIISPQNHLKLRWRYESYSLLISIPFHSVPISNLVVLFKSNIQCAFTETLSLHINAILADESHTTLTPCNPACARPLPVILRMSRIKFVWNTCLSHLEGSRLV